MNIINHTLPVYYNTEYNGLFVVHEKTDKTAIVGGCCHFYDDAYTNICRYEIPLKILKTWKRINKRTLSSYSFIETKTVSSRNAVCVKDIPVSKEEISNDYKRCLWFENPNILKSWCERY